MALIYKGKVFYFDKEKLTLVPPVSLFLAQISPPWAATISLHIARPKPEPLSDSLIFDPCLKASNILSNSFEGIPIPSSITEIIRPLLFRLLSELISTLIFLA